MEKLVVSFMHSNYLIRPYGTEKFVRELSSSMKKNKINHLCFFSMYHDYGSKSVGVIFNDKFVGIYKYFNIKELLIKYVVNYDLSLSSIHIHNFLNHDLEYIKELIKFLNVNVYVFAHDFYLICNEYKLIDSNFKFCGFQVPSCDKCINCKNNKNGIKHFKIMNEFMFSIDRQLKFIVCPSDFVKEKLSISYPSLKNKMLVRPHLNLEGNLFCKPLKGPIRVAFAGLQVDDKGYGFWKKIIHELAVSSKNDYQFYYLGTGQERNDSVKNVYVSTVEQGEDAMSKAIKDNQIDIVFMWTQCPETYSYVYYETLINGVFIITNINSGNVKDEVNNRKNGKVFADFDSCIDYFKNSKMIVTDINNYRCNNSRIPNLMMINSSLDNLIGDNCYCENSKKNIVNVKTQFLKTILYKVKHFKMAEVM